MQGCTFIRTAYISSTRWPAPAAGPAPTSAESGAVPSRRRAAGDGQDVHVRLPTIAGLTFFALLCGPALLSHRAPSLV